MANDPEPIRIPVTDVFDLHTVQPKEVAAVVEAYLEEANLLGLKRVRIIHGRGTGVQRQIVRSVLARTQTVVAFDDSSPELGGWGATTVLLRARTRASQSRSDCDPRQPVWHAIAGGACH